MKKTMHSLWKEAHADNISYVDSYFHTYFKEDETRVLRVDGNIEASLQVHAKNLSLHGKLLKTSFLVGCIGSLSDRKSLVESVLDEVSKSDLITLIQTDHPEIYESLGFETVIESRVFNMSSALIPDFPMDGIVLDPASKDLVKVYNRFTKYFTGYFVRTEHDFELMKQDLRNQKGSFVGYSIDGVLCAYARIINHGTYVDVLECVYDKSGSLLRLLSFVSRGVSRIVFTASESERINKVIPEARGKKIPFIMARINDKELFERLYHIKIISAYSAFNAFGLPLFNRDFL